MKNYNLTLFAISGTHLFPALIHYAWTRGLVQDSFLFLSTCVRCCIGMCTCVFSSVYVCVCVCYMYKTRPKREREWLLGKWLGLGVTCTAMHWWSCETCSNYTLLKKKVDPLSWAESVCTCVQKGALVCVCVCVVGRGVVRLVMGSDVASCNTTHLRICPISNHQSVLKWSRTADFSVKVFVGQYNKKSWTMRWMSLNLYASCIVVFSSSVYNQMENQLPLLLISSILICSLSLSLTYAFSCCFHCGF